MSEGPDDARPLGRAESEDYVRFDTFGPFSEPTDWHVNRRIDVGGIKGVTNTGYVMQRASGREQWLVIAFEKRDDEWEVADAAIRGADGNQAPVIDAPEVLALAEDQEGLA